MNYKLLVDTAMLAGEIMLLGGAETYRVEDTMSRILKISGLEKTETFVTPTGIFLTLAGSKIDPITLVKRVDNRVTNISHIYEVNNISRKLCSEELSLEDAYEALNKIRSIKQYSKTAYYLCIMICSLSFTILLGGNWLDSVIAGLNGGLIVIVLLLTSKAPINTFIKNLAASIFVAFNSMFFLHKLGLNLHLDTLIGGSVMPLLPGVAITNAVRDTLQGDYVSGGARAIEAFVSATSTAAGIGIGIALYSFVAGGINL
jgi:uncharacterized membrane protein YjjP (DUF1212 family)